MCELPTPKLLIYQSLIRTEDIDAWVVVFYFGMHV